MSEKRDPFETLSNIKSRKVEWLWKYYIPFDRMTLLEGDPQVGKSYFAMYLAAMITIGGKMPTGDCLEKGNVLYITSEDDPADTVRPRIEAMGGDVEKIRFMQDFFPLDEKGREKLITEIEEHEPALIVIDTLYSFLSDDIDLTKSTTIRHELHRLDEIFRDHGCAGLIIRHWTKATKGKAIYRGTGTMDFVSVVRVCLAVATDPNDPSRRVLANVKTNIGPKPKSLVFELMPKKNSHPVLKWRGESDLTADDLENPEIANSESQLDRAMGFLKVELASGPVGAKQIRRKAKAMLFPKRTIDRAKKQAGIVSRKSEEGWTWHLRNPDGENQ